MHELSLISALVEQVEAVALKQSFKSVSNIRLAIGELSGVDPSCFEFCFSEGTRDSVLFGAKLTMEVVGAEMKCRSCGQVSHSKDRAWLACSQCQSNDIRIQKGREFKIIDMDVN